MIDLTEAELSLPLVMASQGKNIIEVDHAPSNIDLNKNLVAFHNGSSSCSKSMSMEVGKTADVGKELGFEIDSTNPVLLEAMGVIGEINKP